jgi:hypothetical protein
VIIPPRFNGPPEIANGGYVAGTLAGYLNSPGGAVVTLRQAPPLAKPLDIRSGDGVIAVYDGDLLIAEATAVPADDPLDAPVPPVSWLEAMAAADRYAGFTSHPFPACFVCGPQRPVGDGLRIFAGRLGDGRTAAPWVVPEDFEPAMLWAALDCPGGWAAPMEQRPYVLGRLAARVDGLPVAGDGCVVMGATLGEQGRKASVLSTVYAPDGRVLATARATWIAIRQEHPS